MMQPDSLGSIDSARESALALFHDAGIPTTREEHWKYTDISRISALIEEAQPEVNDVISTEGLGIANMDAYRIVFMNGLWDANSSVLPEHGRMISLAALTNDADAAGDSNEANELAPLFAVSGDEVLFNGLMALNAATASDGAIISIADGSKLDKPLYILHLNNQNVALRHHLIIGENAEAEIIEHYLGVDDSRALSNISSSVTLKPGAKLEHYRLQQEGGKQSHFSRVDVQQLKDSSYTLHSVELGGLISRADVLVAMKETGASCALNGLFVLDERQHADHHTRIDHMAPHCTSRENYRTVLDGRSHGVFNGKVVVHEGAIKTDSAQSNGNLLLSKNAEIDTKPELEIYNDDVKCAHGATVGQLDRKQLFYLRSRGISEESAQELLTFAFADEVLTAMGNNTVRRHIEKAAFAKLPHSEDLEEMLS